MASIHDYTNYYLNQAGYGNGPVFQGQRFQRGYGLGGFFASLFRSAVPMLKQGAKTVGRALLRTGLNVASDALAGANIKQSAQQHFTQTGHDLANRAVEHLRSQVGSGPLIFKPRRKRPRSRSVAAKKPRVAKKRKTKKLRAKKKPKKRKKQKKCRDIFS